MILTDNHCTLCDMTLAEAGESRPCECCTQCGKNVLTNQPAAPAAKNDGPPVIPVSPPAMQSPAVAA